MPRFYVASSANATPFIYFVHEQHVFSVRLHRRRKLLEHMRTYVCKTDETVFLSFQSRDNVMCVRCLSLLLFQHISSNEMYYITTMPCPHSTHTYLRQALHMLLCTLSFLGNNRKKKGYGVAKLRSDRTNTSSFHLHLPLPVPHPTSRSRQPCSSRVFCTTFLSGNTIVITNRCTSESVLFVCLFVLAFLNSSSWSRKNPRHED
jgi:hypothetical protein